MVLSWAKHDNTVRLKNRYILLSSILVWGLWLFGDALACRYAVPASKLGQMPAARFFGGITVVCVGVGVLASIVIVAFCRLCRLVGIVNLYASTVLLCLLMQLVRIFAWDRGALDVAMFLLALARAFAIFFLVAWLSLRLNSSFQEQTADNGS